MQTTVWILSILVIVGLVFYTREQYTMYPSVNERRLNVIKQMTDDVLMDLKKTTTPYNPIQPIATRPVVVPSYTQPTAQPTAVQPTYTAYGSQANIPAWLYNLSSSIAVEQLRLLNSGYTIERIAEGSPTTRDLNQLRIRVFYNPASDRISRIVQG